MTLRLCSFCGAAPGEHPGHRAAICSDCVRRLAGKAGWAVLPAGPQAASAREALDRVLGDYPEADLEAFSLVHRVVLRLWEPLAPERLALLREEIVRRFGTPEAVVLETRAEPGRERAIYWTEGAAAPLFLALPGRQGPPLPLAEAVPALQAFGALTSGEPAMVDLTDGVCCLVTGDLDLARRALAGVDPAHPLGSEALLADAVRVALQGEWRAAVEALARLEGRSSGLVADLARVNRARLLLLHHRFRAAEDALDRLPLPQARELREGLTAEVRLRAECAQGIEHVATALEEFHRASGAWPESLEQLRPRFLTVLPTCGGVPLRYRRTRSGFTLQAARGWPRWRRALGVVTGPAEMPGGRAGGRSLSGPLESLADRRLTRGLWVAACREGAGDLPGAALALRDLPGGEAAFLRLLMALRRFRAEEAVEDLKALARAPFTPGEPQLLEAWLEPACDAARGSVPELSALFMGLLRAGRTDLLERLLSRLPASDPAERLRYLCENAAVLPQGPTDWPLRQGLQAAFDHRAPEAAVCLEFAVFGGDGPATALLQLARQYRLAGRLLAARDALEEARPPGESPVALLLESALLRLAWDAEGGATEVLRIADTFPMDVNVRLEVLAHLVHVGRPVDLALLPRDPRGELLATWLVGADEAESRCSKLLLRYPGYAAAWLRLATLRQDPAVARQELAQRPNHVPLLALVARLCPEDDEVRERLARLRPDVSDLDHLLDRPLLDPPDPYWALPLELVRQLQGP